MTLTFQNQPCNNTPLSKAQMLDPAYDFNAAMHLVFTSGATGTVSAREMLEAGDCKPWTSGQIAQTIECADDTTAGKYDVSDGGGARPFRPRFYATFWPALKKVQVRYAGEAGLTTELKDLRYALTLTIGRAAPRVVYSLDLTGGPASGGKLHWTMTGWTKRFWIGGKPEQKVNIDHNLPYLAATRIVPNYDVGLTIPEATLKRSWDLHTTRSDGTKRQNQPYDGSYNGQSLWTARMGTVGGRPDIGPCPDWAVAWLYSGDWRMQKMSLTLADIAASWPGHLRESDPTRRLNRDDPAGSGTGSGLPVSITDRKTLVTSTLAYLNWNYTKPADRLIQVGPIEHYGPWYIDGAHQPSPFYVPYVLTGDKYYLDEMVMWAAFSAARPNSIVSRGPTGAEGGIYDELRGAGWVFRNRVEAATMLPDGSPMERYFERLITDALARWEGGLGVVGTTLDGHPVKVWGAQSGNAWGASDGPNPRKPLPLRNWESNGYVNSKLLYLNTWILDQEKQGIMRPGKVATMTSNWMQYFVLYALGRAKELGYPSGPLIDYTSKWLVDMVTKSGRPELMVVYETPVEKPATKNSDGTWTGGGYFTWQTIQTEGFTSSYMTSGIFEMFKRHLAATGEGYNWIAQPAVAYAVDAGVPGAIQTWAWYKTNAIDKMTSRAGNPKWAVMPRSN